MSTTLLPTVAVTLIQPWGTLVVHCGKDLENRTWAPSPHWLQPGARLWIHAGKKLELDTVLDYRELIGKVYRTPRDIPTGALIGHVRFDGVVRESASPWWVGPVGWRLSDPIALATPIPCKGMQGLWTVPSDLLEQVVEVRP